MNRLFTNRNLWILFLAQFVATSGATLSVTLGGIIGNQIALNKALATLPQAFYIIGIASFTIPAALLMRRIGRPRGFSVSALIAIASQALAIGAIWLQNFWLFTGALMVLGSATAFAHQLRFAATESVDAAHAGRAVSFVLMGAVGGAFLGPTLASHGVQWLPAIPYAGGFAVQAVLFALLAVTYLAMVPVAVSNIEIDADHERPLTQIVRQPLFLVAVLAGITAYAVMSLMMTATPISMHVKDGFSIDQTASIIRAHVVGMYLPSLVSGYLVDRFGIKNMLFAGLTTMAVCIGVALAGHEYMHYWWALVLLGIGWNFLFVSGTTLLTKTYRHDERFAAQAVNEFSVFTVSALAALMAGVLIHVYSWNTAVLATTPLVIALFVSLLLVRKKPELR